MEFAFQESVWYVRRAQTSKHLRLKDFSCEQRNTPCCLKFLSLEVPDTPKSAFSQQWEITSSCFVTGILRTEPCGTGASLAKENNRWGMVQHIPGDTSYLNLPRDRAAAFVYQHFICLSPQLPALTPGTPAQFLWELARGQHERQPRVLGQRDWAGLQPSLLVRALAWERTALIQQG